MTPKEKAEELVNNYFKLLNYEFGDEVYSLRDKQPHKCALIAVDEILEVARDAYHEEVLAIHMIYWNKVKQEIEKL